MLPRIKDFGGYELKIHCAPREHPPPHYHVYANDGSWEFKREIDNDNTTVLRGSPPSACVRKIIKWAKQRVNKRLLKRKWKEYNETQ
ncbi:DUF4160 domain-containing protein [Methylobacterium sp. WL122]|nr:DUF4160 domain-containing protein [Methylobacterium sp. WL122]